jgi:protein SCO1/2
MGRSKRGPTPRAPRRALLGIAISAIVLATAACTARDPLPTLQPIVPSSAGANAAAGAAAGAGAVAAVLAAPVAASPAVTPPTPLGPGLGLPSPGAPLPTPLVNDPPAMAPPLWLTTTQGQLFDFHQYMGTPILLYFGYTHCPDVCPASLGVLRETVKKAGVPVQVVFVTVDPDRDTPAILQEYLDYFGQGWIGLTGRNSQILQAAELYGARYQKFNTTSASGYAVGHTTDIYLIDKMGMWVETFPFGSSADQIVPELQKVANG